MLATRVTNKEADRIDAARKSLSRAQWLRWIVIKELREEQK